MTVSPKSTGPLITAGGTAAAAIAGGFLAPFAGLPCGATAALCGLPLAASAAAAGRSSFAAAAGLGLASAAMLPRDLPDLTAFAAALVTAAVSSATLSFVSDQRRAAERKAQGLEQLANQVLADAAAKPAPPVEPPEHEVVGLATTLLTLQEAGRRIATHLDPDSVVPAVVTTVRSVLGCRDASVYYWDSRAGTLADAFPTRPRDIGRYAPDAVHGMAAWVLNNRQTLTREAVETDLHLGNEVGPESRRPAGIAPLLAGNELLGLLVVDDPERPDPEFSRLLTLVANLAALGLKNAQMFRRIEEMARRDALTGLLNRGGFEAALDDLLEAAKAGQPLTVLLADFDRFKQLNDEYGHAAGDAVLRESARLWQAVLPEDAVIGRFGGEEFVAALPGHDLAEAAELAEALRAATAAHPFAHEARPLSATVSVGLAAFGPSAATASGLAREADVALYKAKAEGRNRVRAAEPAKV